MEAFILRDVLSLCFLTGGSVEKIPRSRRELKDEIESLGAPKFHVVFRSYDEVIKDLLHFLILTN